MGNPDARDGIFDGATGAAKSVRYNYKSNADMIKVMGTGGILDLGTNPTGPQLAQDEFDAVVSTAHDYGMTVATHCHGDEGIRRAIKAGVDSVEHGTFMSEELMDQMVQKQIFWVPTLSAV